MVRTKDNNTSSVCAGNDKNTSNINCATQQALRFTKILIANNALSLFQRYVENYVGSTMYDDFNKQTEAFSNTNADILFIFQYNHCNEIQCGSRSNIDKELSDVRMEQYSKLDVYKARFKAWFNISPLKKFTKS